jgi:NAD(P)H-hydrate epimerase
MPAEHAHKHARGVVEVIAGSRGATGAAVLAAEAALRSRAGLVHLVVDAEIYDSVAGSAGAVMVHPDDQWRRNPRSSDAVLVGPGWGTGIGRAISLRNLLSDREGGVLDADALNLLAEWSDRFCTSLKDGRWVMTPHVGELARLVAVSTAEVQSDLIGSARVCAERWDCIVVAKSSIVVIARPNGRYSVVDGTNVALGTAGSGDLLAGIICGLLASGAEPFDAACTGVVLHQQAGFLGRKADGLFCADDLLPQISRLVDNEWS